MYRTLFELGPFSIRSYGVMLAIAFWLGIELSARAAKRRGLDPNSVVDLGIVVLISSVIGSRLLYVLTHISEYQNDKLGVFRVWEGGLMFYGGLAAGLVFGIGYLRWKGLPVLELTDVVAPQMALGVAITRIGCFLNGCCFGQPSSLPWACSFPSDAQAGWVMGKTPVHPVQIYGVVANLLLFLFLRHLLRRDHATGSVFYGFLILYGVWRFASDFLRYYEDQVHWHIGDIVFTWSQIVSILMVIAGVILLSRSIAWGETHGEP